MLDIDVLRLWCSSVRFAQLLQTCEFLCGTWNGQRVLLDSVQFVL